MELIQLKTRAVIWVRSIADEASRVPHTASNSTEISQIKTKFPPASTFIKSIRLDEIYTSLCYLN